MATPAFVRIDRAVCKRCGEKGGIVVRGTFYPLPVTVDAHILERVPWVCACRNKIALDVEVVE